MKRRRRLAATLGLVALVIVDIALVFAALRITGRSSAAETPSADGTIATASSGPEPVTTSAAPEPSASATGTSAAPTNVPGVPLTVVLSVVDGSLAWRATVGSCSGGAAVQITTDGGKTWRNRTSPYPVITRVQATDATKGFVVGRRRRLLDGRAHDHRRRGDLARDRPASPTPWPATPRTRRRSGRPGAGPSHRAGPFRSSTSRATRNGAPRSSAPTGASVRRPTTAPPGRRPAR